MSNTEIFRVGVGLIVQNEEGQVLAFERADVPEAWQLPQGGVEQGEKLEDAAWRELREETGLTREHVTLCEHLEPWIGYELPKAMRSSKTGRGQVHRWFRFVTRPGLDAYAFGINGDGEFRNSRWMSMNDLARNTVSFRQAVYRMLSSWLSDLGGPTS